MHSGSSDPKFGENIKSPLNYTGGKFRLLPQIKKFFPAGINIFYDIFSGGCNVGINVEARNIVCVDKNRELIRLFKFLLGNSPEDICALIENAILKYGLSDSWRYGYKYYGCGSSSGLGSFNREPFARLKKDFNLAREPGLLLVLIIFSFNNQIRFNGAGQFNLPVGKRDFNGVLRKRMLLFLGKMHARNISFLQADFRELDIEKMAAERAFLYLDPPYSLGLASYNENGGWGEEDDRALFAFLTACHRAGLKFALSNVAEHKLRTNTVLLEWRAENNFRINFLRANYRNSSYHKKDRSDNTREILVTNY